MKNEVWSREDGFNIETVYKIPLGLLLYRNLRTVKPYTLYHLPSLEDPMVDVSTKNYAIWHMQDVWQPHKFLTF